MITALLIGWPLVAALLVLMTKGASAKKLAFAASVIELGIAVAAYVQFRHNPASAFFVMDHYWVSSLGIKFKIGMDGISLLLVLLTTLLVPFIILSSYKNEYKNAPAFYSLILFMQMALVGVFVAMDGFLFYIFWELALIPIYFICLLWGGENRGRITFKFFVYTLLGSLFMLVALIYLYQHTAGKHTFEIGALYEAGRSMDAAHQAWIFWAMFLAFAIKMPVFPLHTWQPDTYTTAPTPGTMLLSGIMLKMGTYGLIRWLLPLAPLGVAEWGHTAIALSVISVIYASCMAIAQKDFKRLIAYSSIAHVGLISAGIFAYNVQGLQGGLVQMFSHGINVVGLFFIAEIISTGTGTREISKLGGIRNVAPWFAVLFLVVLLGSVALPLTNGFVGEFLLINGLYQYNSWFAAFAGLSVILGAVYMLRSYQGVMLGETNSLTASFKEIGFSEKIVLIPIVILILVLGVYPKPLLEMTEPAINALIQTYPLK